MDIQKEIEAFEVWFESNFESTKLHKFDNGVYLHERAQMSWEAWQAAKAQAVPDGFVVVPMVPSERMIHAVRQCYEGEAYLPYSLYSEFVNQAIIERMEAQESANE